MSAELTRLDALVHMPTNSRAEQRAKERAITAELSRLSQGDETGTAYWDMAELIEDRMERFDRLPRDGQVAHYNARRTEDVEGIDTGHAEFAEAWSERSSFAPKDVK